MSDPSPIMKQPSFRPGDFATGKNSGFYSFLICVRQVMNGFCDDFTAPIRGCRP
jgi:hypothetical protein